MLSAMTRKDGQEQSFVLHTIRPLWTIEEIQGTRWHCRHCQGEMIPVKPLDRVWHFRHKQSAPCPYTEKYGSGGGQSTHHNQMKYRIALGMIEQYKDQRWQVDYEVPIDVPVAGGTRKRIADVLMQSETGTQLIVEVQLSQVPLSQVQERNTDYLNAGFDVWWAFPRGNWSSPIMQHLSEIGQFSLLLEVEQSAGEVGRGI